MLKNSLSRSYLKYNSKLKALDFKGFILHTHAQI